jgi:hypothetical protein
MKLGSASDNSHVYASDVRVVGVVLITNIVSTFGQNIRYRKPSGRARPPPYASRNRFESWQVRSGNKFNAWRDDAAHVHDPLNSLRRQAFSEHLKGVSQLSFRPPSVDTTHAMYQPDKRAKPKPTPLACAPRKGNRNGTHEEKQAWMRARNNKSYHALQVREANDTQGAREKRLAAENQRMAELEGRRETELLAAAQSEVQKRRIARCEVEIALIRLLPESETQRAYLPAMGEADWHAERRLIEKGTQNDSRS